VIWEAYISTEPSNRLAVEVNILETEELDKVKDFEDDFFYQKRIQ
jgi:hypothetical protein